MKFLYKLVTARKQKSRFFSALLSFLFFIGMVGLYSGLGTFVSSCGTVTFTTCNVSVTNYNGWTCLPYSYGSDVNFQAAAASGWKINLKVNYDGADQIGYSFGPSLTSGSATLDYNIIKGVTIPFNRAYSLKLSVRSPCHCPSSNTYYIYEKYTSIYPQQQVASNIGILDAPSISSCN